MNELETAELNQVNGGFLVTATVVAIAAYTAGYAYGAMTKEKPKPEPCEPNETTGKQCA